MLLRQPISTLFPYTTLFRSHSGGWHVEVIGEDAEESPYVTMTQELCKAFPRDGGCFLIRSEEHTSELQSHSDLVCRLLLEKKKNKRENNKTRDTTYKE